MWDLDALPYIFFSGFFGEVFQGIWNGTDVAIKVFLEQDLTTENMEDFCNEITILRYLIAQNITLHLIFWSMQHFLITMLVSFVCVLFSSSRLRHPNGTHQHPLTFPIQSIYSISCSNVSSIPMAIYCKTIFYAVILFLGACTKPPRLSMVTEYMERGSLYYIIHSSGQKKKLSWRRRLKMLRDICR